jgi:hypothetical protein
MVALTGKPSREWVHDRLLELRQGGIEQFMLYPRSGCELEYLSEEYFAACENFIQEAQSLGFSSLWLYDEFNWPSGQCGGRVQAANPDFGLQLLQCVPTAAGEWECTVTIDPRYPNLLNAKAMEYFMQLTHEAYAKRFGSLFGIFIKGVFTDEPSPGYGANYFKDQQGVRKIPYYPEFEAEYEAFHHVPFRQDLSNPQFAERCQRVVAERFRKNYFDRLRSWCEKHKLILTGHLMSEWAMRPARNHNGDPLLAITGFGMPGCDDIFTRPTIKDFEWLTLGTVQYGIRKRQNGGIAELFAYGPADMPLSRMNAMFYLTALFGVNHYFLAVSQLDFRGNIGKYAWFNPYSADQPWWDNMPLLAESSKKAARLAERKAAPEVGVRYPAECIEITDLLKSLVRRQIPWHLIGTEENCSDEVEVIAPYSGGYRLERSGGDYASLNALFDKLETIFLRKVTVFDENGNLCNNVFVRVFADGGAFIQDMSDVPASRKIKVLRNGTSVEYELGGRCGIELPAWEVLRDRDNIFRASFGLDGQFDFELTEPMRLKFAVRSYHAIEAELDGKKIVAADSAQWLSKGFQGLYRGCEISLAAGKHSCRKLSGDDIYPFLPSIWIAGDFAVTGNKLQRDFHDGNGLTMFAGVLTQTAMVDIPRNAVGISCDTDELVTELFIDGQSLGTCIDRPFFWSIPAQYRGRRVNIKIRRQTSIAPSFGNVLGFRNFHPDWVNDVYNGQYPIKHFVVEMDFKVL